MELTKDRVVEILETALANPRYLHETTEGISINWFCSVVELAVNDLYAVGTDENVDVLDSVTNHYIYPSIGELAFLKSYMIDRGIIPDCTQYDSDVYREAAHAHWRALIEKIKSEK